MNTATLTFAEVLGAHDITVADEALADIEVPVLAGPQRQGDVLIVPRGPLGDAERASFTDVPPEGVTVVFGEATGNTHLLTAADGTVRWLPAVQSRGSVLLGVVEVTEDATAYLIHTDEHGANGIAPGAYTLHGKREQAEEIRRVAD